jgi:hypothetical protein
VGRRPGRRCRQPPGPNSAAARLADDLPSAITYLTRVLKPPTIGRCWQDLADQAREENWSHEEYLAAVLQRQVTERESAGTTMRIRTRIVHAPERLLSASMDDEALLSGLQPRSTRLIPDSSR